MSRSAYDVGREALRLWRSVHGNASLNQQCQRFDGYYWQWAYQGNENITAYGTATAAANASSIYTSNINDPNAQPGDLWYWWWASDGHVATVLGHDAAGRVLVTHTSSSGDVVEQWTNNVRISHADTIPLKFRGGSHTDGANARRTGLAAWPAKPTQKGADDMPRILNIRETHDGRVNTATIFFDGGPGVGIKGISNPYHLGLLQRFIADKPGDHMFPAELAIINTYMAPNAPTLTAATVEAAVAKAIKAAGGSVEAASIAAAVEMVLKDDFAAIPGATAVKLGEKLAAKQ